MAGLRALLPKGDFIGVGDDFFVADVRYDRGLDFLAYPCRFDCFLAFYCISGHLKMMINLREFDVVEDSLFVNLPGNIIKVASVDAAVKESLRFVVMAMSREYMAGLNIDMDRAVEKTMLLLGNPCFVLDAQERAVAAQHLDLARTVMRSGLPNKRQSIGSLVSSVFCLAGGMMEKRLNERDVSSVEGERSKEVFERFIALVSEHYVRERSVSYYAGRLCITPKYLARLVRAASGRTASDWIDGYVVMEAKHLLKFSGLEVKEIVRRLNFPDAPTFHKFFRRRTGMTPGQYRRSGDPVG